MVLGALLYTVLAMMGVQTVDTLLLVAGACVISAWMAWLLHKACDDVDCVIEPQA